MDTQQTPQNPNHQQNDDVFHGLSNDPLVDAGYGPVSHVPRPKKPQHLLRNLLIGLGAVVVIAGAVFGGMALANKHKNSKPVAQQAQSSAGQSTSTSTDSASTSTSTPATPAANSKSYTSNETALGVTFSYPESWTVSPASTTATGKSAITVTSPIASFTDASGASVKGRAVVTMRPSRAGIAELNSGSPAAAQNSVQIGYTNPAAGQHKYPYITFLHFTTGQKATGAFEEVMITGVTTFASGNSVSSSSLAGLDPVISVAFTSCTGDACPTPLSINNTGWNNNALAQEALNIFQSIQIK